MVTLLILAQAVGLPKLVAKALVVLALPKLFKAGTVTLRPLPVPYWTTAKASTNSPFT